MVPRLESLRTLRQARPWIRGHASLLLAGVFDRGRIRRKGLTDREHMIAAVHWLGRAQDVTKDGGICGRYRLDRGWTSSYPETTGYLVPTLLALARELKAPELVERARRAVDFLLGVQLPSGAFPGLEIAENRTEPSPFNTAQIVNGLVAWHRERPNEPDGTSALVAARRAGDWLLSVQDEDGAFRRHVYRGIAATYHAHASCWLAELGVHAHDDRYLDGAVRHLDWVLRHRDAETGFIDLCGFSTEDHAARRSVTHTLAYTLAGVLTTSLLANRDDGVAAVRVAAEKVARRLELDGRLPGVLDHRFRGAADYQCLTGNAQMALVWLKLFAHDGSGGDVRLLNAALKAIDLVKAAQPMTNPNPGIRGGIPGSDPVTGGYIPLAVPNWAAKFFLDAVMEKGRVLGMLERGEITPRVPGARRVHASLPAIATRAETPPRIVLLTTPRSKKCIAVMEALALAGVTPDAVVIEERPEPPFAARLGAALREEGLKPILGKLGRKESGGTPLLQKSMSGGTPLPRKSITVGSLDRESDLAAIRALEADLFVAAGAGILRKALLSIPRLGTINAHMGLLPWWRGMNVAEWAALHRAPIGVTVHLVDPGIDTGDLLATHELEAERVARCGTIEELRALVDDAQLALLAAAVRFVRDSGTLPPRVPQTRDEGRQYFTMHPELKAALARRLAINVLRA